MRLARASEVQCPPKAWHAAFRPTRERRPGQETKTAIVIGLSQARKTGAKVPRSARALAAPAGTGDGAVLTKNSTPSQINWEAAPRRQMMMRAAVGTASAARATRPMSCEI
jgi:hypothetical protein